jgi:hypothetical protein
VQERPRVLEGVLFGVVLHVMEAGLPLRVHGPVSRSAMYNLEDVQAYWRLWRPQRYKRVDIIPDEIVDLERRKPGRRAISAFSGGVDSTFTVLRHKSHPAAMEAYNLDAVLMVHGLDISLSNEDHFKMAIERANPFLRKMGVAMRVVRTTLKELNLQDWLDSHAGQLASCLHQFSEDFEFGLIGSTGSFADPELAHGSNPALDHLYSGDEFEIVYDGAGFRKTEKVAAIASDPVATAGIRVCWEGKDQWRNCGRCGKCIRTRLMFMMAGIPNPSCFDGPLDLAALKTMRIANVSEWSRVKEVSDYARARGVRAEWMRPLHRRMAAYRRQEIAAKFSAKAGRALDGVGLKQGVKGGLRALGMMR